VFNLSLCFICPLCIFPGLGPAAAALGAPLWGLGLYAAGYEVAFNKITIRINWLKCVAMSVVIYVFRDALGVFAPVV